MNDNGNHLENMQPPVVRGVPPPASPHREEIPLTEEQSAALNEIEVQLNALAQQKVGMIMLICRMHNIRDAGIEYREGKLWKTPRE